MGMEVVGSTPGQFDALVRSELAKWGKVVKDNHIQAD
jgi:tripartite-type tricarboxylate transporter receptor subunit TctC